MPLHDADIRRTYGERIAKARLAQGLSQRQLAERLSALGVKTSPQAVSQWESGATSPRVGCRLTLATLLEVTTGDLFAIPDIDAEVA